MRAVILASFLIVGVYAWSGWKPPKYVPPCSEPIAYSISTFDRRFGLSYKDFLAALADAEKIWEEPSGINLFLYSPEEAVLPINLIYDYRQEITETLSDINETVEENEATYEALHNQFKTLKAQYDSSEKAYNTLVSKFNEKNAEYEDLVKSWNSGPRTSKEEFNQLEEKRVELQNDLSKLRTFEASLNEQGRQVNVLVDRLNRLVAELNLDVDKFNTIGSQRGETFTGGLYVVSPIGERSIDIYEFKNRDKLVRVLAHELGHALGLEHIDDPEAIMYHLNRGDRDALTDSDLVELQKLCGIM